MKKIYMYGIMMLMGTTLFAQQSDKLILSQATNDLKAIKSSISSGCNLSSTEIVSLVFMNNGTSPQSNFGLQYSINGGSVVTENYPATINPGDTVTYIFFATYDMSAQNTYILSANTLLTGDLDMSNDTAKDTASTTTSMSPPYTTSFEQTPVTDFLGWKTLDVDGSGWTWDLVQSSPYSGAYCIRAFENNVSAASNDWLFSRCIDFDAANSYRVSWWTRLTSGYEGQFAVFYSPIQDTVAMMNIYPLTSLTNANVWVKDSTDFAVPFTGPHYLGFQALQTNAAATVAIRLDDINVIDLGPATGVNNIIEIGTSVFPNPSNGMIFVSTKMKGAAMEVFNMMGERVYSASALSEGQNNFNLNFLATGTYVVKVSCRGNSAVRKISIIK